MVLVFLLKGSSLSNLPASANQIWTFMLPKTINISFNFIVRHQHKPITTQTSSFSSAVLRSERNFCRLQSIRFPNQDTYRNSCRHLTTPKKRSREVTVTKLNAKLKMEWPKITLFGDSITRRSMDPENGCWGSMIAYQVGNFFEVNVRGFEGYNSEWTLELMPKLFPKSYLDKVEIFIPFLGHNDALEDFPTYLTPDKFETNKRAMIKYLNDNGVENRKIILITPTWYHDESFTKYMQSLGFPRASKRFDEAKKYADAIIRIGQDTGIEVVDFFAISAKYEPLKEMFCDGVHYSRAGAKLLFDCLMPVIEKKIEASYKKPLADLWHVVPLEKRPAVVAALEAYKKAQTGK